MYLSRLGLGFELGLKLGLELRQNCLLSCGKFVRYDNVSESNWKRIVRHVWQIGEIVTPGQQILDVELLLTHVASRRDYVGTPCVFDSSVGSRCIIS